MTSLRCSMNKFWVMGKAGSLGNTTVMERVVDFGDRLGDTSVYPKFFHLLDSLMIIVSKAQMDELIREIVAHSNYT